MHYCFLQKGVARGDEADVPESGIFFNRVTRTAHQINAANETKSACGLAMSPLIYEFASGPYALDGCALCWRPGCCNWIPAPEEVSVTGSAENELLYTPTSVVSDREGVDFDDLVLSVPDDGF